MSPWASAQELPVGAPPPRTPAPPHWPLSPLPWSLTHTGPICLFVRKLGPSESPVPGPRSAEDPGGDGGRVTSSQSPALEQWPPQGGDGKTGSGFCSLGRLTLRPAFLEPGTSGRPWSRGPWASHPRGAVKPKAALFVSARFNQALKMLCCRKTKGVLGGVSSPRLSNETHQLLAPPRPPRRPHHQGRRCSPIIQTRFASSNNTSVLVDLQPPAEITAEVVTAGLCTTPVGASSPGGGGALIFLHKADKVPETHCHAYALIAKPFLTGSLCPPSHAAHLVRCTTQQSWREKVSGFGFLHDPTPMTPHVPISTERWPVSLLTGLGSGSCRLNWWLVPAGRDSPCPENSRASQRHSGSH